MDDRQHNLASATPPLKCDGCGRTLGECVHVNRLKIGNAIIGRRVYLTCAQCGASTIWRPQMAVMQSK